MVAPQAVCQRSANSLPPVGSGPFVCDSLFDSGSATDTGFGAVEDTDPGRTEHRWVRSNFCSWPRLKDENREGTPSDPGQTVKDGVVELDVSER